MARRRPKNESEDKIETGAWLTTYSDLMNNLLVLFMMLYAMSIMDMEKFQAIADQFRIMYSDGKIYEQTDDTEPPAYNNALIITPPEDEILPDLTEDFDPDSDIDSHVENEEEPSDHFDILYEKIKLILYDKGYDGFVDVEKVDEYIYFRFKDGILFYPNLSDMKQEANGILMSVGEIIKEAEYLIANIDICGYTARVDDPSVVNYLSWELSVNRSLTVLKFLINNCDLPQEKMSIAGYAHFQPYADDSTAEGRALNRRVEIRISKDPNIDTQMS